MTAAADCTYDPLRACGCDLGICKRCGFSEASHDGDRRAMLPGELAAAIRLERMRESDERETRVEVKR